MKIKVTPYEDWTKEEMDNLLSEKYQQGYMEGLISTTSLVHSIISTYGKTMTKGEILNLIMKELENK